MPADTGHPSAGVTADRPAEGATAVVVATTATDLLVYVVVLGLAVQWVPQVLSETFAATLVTAVLLKVVLEVVLRVKQLAAGRIRSASGPLATAAGVVVLWVIMVSSKFLLLETVDLVLGDRVSLGGFWSVTGLVVVLVAARALVRRGVDALLGDAAGPPAEAAHPTRLVPPDRRRR
jgi:hypothetical protein